MIIFKNEEDFETWEMKEEDQATYRGQRVEIVSDIKKLGAENLPARDPELSSAEDNASRDSTPNRRTRRPHTHTDTT